MGIDLAAGALAFLACLLVPTEALFSVRLCASCAYRKYLAHVMYVCFLFFFGSFAGFPLLLIERWSHGYHSSGEHVRL